MGLDTRLLFKINGLVGRNKTLDFVGFFAGRWLLFWAIVLFPFFAYLYLPNFVSTLFVVLFVSMWLVGWIISMFLGVIIRRQRPYLQHKQKVNIRFTPFLGKWKSFPSDHAMTSFVLLILVSLFAPWIIIVLYIVFFLLVSWGRVFSGVHYPLDILGGIFVALVSFSFVYYFTSLIF